MGQGRPICGADCDVFLSWASSSGFDFGPEIALQDVEDAFRGFTDNDLRWICAALRQANVKKPDLAAIRNAALARNVAILRPTNG